tara:strand:+ start:119 stop:538 length:420 start_codon:yes stop_codon:yes gene_type:complete
MTQKVNWRNGDEWRTLAYEYYRDSRTYRYILALNPSFDIRYIPSPGVVVNVGGDVGPGEYKPSQASIPGTLQQVDLNLDLRAGPEVAPTSVQNSIFPYDTLPVYADRLGQYTAAAILAPDRTNGYSLDSPQVGRDTQRA